LGCSSPQDDGAEELHEEHFPEHWPNSIFDASTRLKQLVHDPAPQAISTNIAVEKELIDLIRWLPELVADSDISRVEFDAVDAWTSNCLPGLEAAYGQGAKLEQLRKDDELAGNVLKLHELCRRELERIDALGQQPL
jgi:hypothetical protein